MKWVLPKTYKRPVYPFQRSADQDAEKPAHHAVVIVGSGPVGLMAAADLAQRGIPSVVLSKETAVSIGSRAICFAKKTLEISDRINFDFAARLLEKGVTWNTGKVFYQEDEVYSFNLQAEEGHKMPAFINLQQYYFEAFLVEELQSNAQTDLRWKNEVVNVIQDGEKATVEIATPEGNYTITADYVLACDGVNSKVRAALNLSYEGEKFEENFLIADIRMQGDFPTERWFWFDPPFNPGHSALLHKQPDGVWRIDLQLGWDIDAEKELASERIRERIRQMLGPDVVFELEWTSVYQFRCMRMPQFVHDRVIFAGDSAHLVSPFGARGANSGIQDIDNLIWKLGLVMNGLAPVSLLKTYDIERGPATDENIRYSSQATDFISPKSEISMRLRNAALQLAKSDDLVKRLINSGRLSHPFRYLNSPLITVDEDAFGGTLQPGYSIPDVPLQEGKKLYWLSQLTGNRFCLLSFGRPSAELQRQLESCAVSVLPISIGPGGRFQDVEEKFASRYDAKRGSWYLIRPDQHLAARGKITDYEKIKSALDRALGKMPTAKQEWVEDRIPVYEKDDFYSELIKALEALPSEKWENLKPEELLEMIERAKDLDTFRLLLAKQFNR